MDLSLSTYLNLIGLFVQTVVILGGGFMALGAIKNEVKEQGLRLGRIDGELEDLRKVVV